MGPDPPGHEKTLVPSSVFLHAKVSKAPGWLRGCLKGPTAQPLWFWAGWRVAAPNLFRPGVMGSLTSSDTLSKVAFDVAQCYYALHPLYADDKLRRDPLSQLFPGFDTRHIWDPMGAWDPSGSGPEAWAWVSAGSAEIILESAFRRCDFWGSPPGVLDGWGGPRENKPALSRLLAVQNSRDTSSLPRGPESPWCTTFSWRVGQVM